MEAVIYHGLHTTLSYYLRCPSQRIPVFPIDGSIQFNRIEVLPQRTASGYSRFPSFSAFHQVDTI